MRSRYSSGRRRDAFVFLPFIGTAVAFLHRHPNNHQQVAVVTPPVAPVATTTTSLVTLSAERGERGYETIRGIEISLGSEDMAEEDSDDHEDDDFDLEQKSRQSEITKILAQQDEEFKEERRKKKWGDYADAKSREDIMKVAKDAKAKIAVENQLKAQMAQENGVLMEVLAPQDNGVSEDNGNIRITAGSAVNWFDKVDKNLQSEWEDMESNNEEVADGDTSGNAETVEVNGKMVSRDTLQGVRVGSAGGWSLEVFPGDFVVHRRYGIGRFEQTCLIPKAKLTMEEQEAQDARRADILEKEIKKIPGGVTPEKIQAITSAFGTEEDTDPVSNPRTTVLEISYADGIVHVPVDRAYRLSRYRAGDSVIKPKLSRVRGGTWQNARKKVEENTLQLAQDVMALYARRETLQRAPFDPSKEDEVKKLGGTFKFEPTKDQYKCFEDVENDMVWRTRPMDRLICGDVGFGKTEIAMRAIYRCVANGRQAALLAPTGVLSSQHFKNVVKRMGEGSEFDKRVAHLRGGMGARTKAGKALRKVLESGEVDVVVGTHALLGNDLAFKDLGLLVVDEEQRFGVKQKERLKLICEGVDVLTLSATPIPRTLQMSLSGLRDTSTIRSPPPMRKATITYVQDYNEDLIKLAIGQELARNGQCYYVVPRIKMIEDAEATILSHFPDARVVIAHGRMARNDAEENVAKFAEGDYDVLLATTVIENGVDIPTVNTIIIQDSQAFGMSSLYQLRGRVGRSDLQGYAYLLHRAEAISEQSVMRLQAIGELSELGSGFDVANRDLEIRGAGSLLGTEQSGMAAKVGYDLYMRMLKKSIRQLRGLDLPLVPRTNVLLPNDEGSLEIRTQSADGKGASTHSFQISEDYMSDDEERERQQTAARLAESTEVLVKLTNDWKEEYGPLPPSLQEKIKTLHLHVCTRQLGIDLVGLLDNGDGRIDCVMRSPGLRPRHWGTIVPLLPRGAAPKGLDVIFPARFTLSGEDQEVVGGEKPQLDTLIEDESISEDSEKWDALDQEEMEAMKEISSAYSIRNFEDADIENYPRFEVKDIHGEGVGVVDRLLQLLLKSTKVVIAKQKEEKDNAKVAANLRDKRALLAKRKRSNASRENQRYMMK